MYCKIIYIYSKYPDTPISQKHLSYITVFSLSDQQLITMDLIKKMLSITPERPLTNTQRFTYVSAVLAYIMAGLSMMLVPGLWITASRLDLPPRDTGYFILVGSGLVGIGFYYVVTSRNKSSQTPNHGPLLGTVASRLLIVNAVVIRFYTEGLISGRFTFLFSSLDSTLAVVTYIIWSREEKNASFSKYLQQTWSAMNPFSPNPPNYKIFQALGFAQFIMSFFAPSMLLNSGVVPSTIQGSHAEGILKSYFFAMGVQACLQILASGAQNDSFPIAFVFYRAIWNIPIFVLLTMMSQIPRGLSTTLVIYDVMCIIATVALFARARRIKGN